MRIEIVWVPTVPECSLALNIALCIRVKLAREMPEWKDYKVDILVKDGKHSLKKDIDKQVNDKERYTAAMENELVMAAIEKLIKEPDYY